MQTNTQRIRIGILLLTLVTLAATELKTVYPAITLSSDAESLHEQIQEDIQQAIQSNLHAESFAVWDQGGFTPSDVLKNIRDLNSTQAWKVLCQNLLQLKTEELGLFENELALPENQKHLPASCRSGAIESKLSPLWNFHPAEIFAAKESFPITLTFNGGPHLFRTRRILSALKQSEIKATFFFSGEQAKRHAEIIKEVVENQHEIGLLVDLPPPPRMSLQQMEHRITAEQTLIENASGRKITSVRIQKSNLADLHPAISRQLNGFLKTQGLKVIPWGKDSLDWKIRNPQKLYRHVVTAIRANKTGMISFRDQEEQTALILPRLLEEILKSSKKESPLLTKNQF